MTDMQYSQWMKKRREDIKRDLGLFVKAPQPVSNEWLGLYR